MNYSDQLKDPRWARLSAECKAAANYRCESCGRCEGPIQLQSHHKCYLKGKMAWEYKTSDLKCLCSVCHHQTTNALQNLRMLFSDVDYWHIAGFVDACERMRQNHPLRTVIQSMQIVAEHPEMIHAILETYRQQEEELATRLGKLLKQPKFAKQARTISMPKKKLALMLTDAY